MKLVYFSWIRERIGKPEEEVVLPESVRDVSSLLKWLKSRGEEYEAFHAFIQSLTEAAASVPGAMVKGSGWKNRHGSAMPASFVYELLGKSRRYPRAGAAQVVVPRCVVSGGEDGGGVA